MKIELPLGVKKHSKFIENAASWDNNCKDKAYIDIMHKMNLNEEIYKMMTKKYENIEDILDEICIELNKIAIKYSVNKYALAVIAEKSVASKRDMKRLFGDMTMRTAELYHEVGKIMNEKGILDVFLKRTNRAFANIGLPFLQINKNQAIDEFDKGKNQRSTYYVLNMKTLFQINKITKFIDSIEYGAMLENDKKNTKTNDESKTKLLSNFKTDYLRKIVQAQNSMPEEQLKYFINFEIAKKEYYRLFGEHFYNLNYDEELEKVELYEARKENLYDIKSNLVSQLIGITYQGLPRKIFENDIKNCGIGIDENGKLVLGMNVYGYIMPFTVHIQKSNILDMIEGEKYGQERLGNISIKIPKVEKYNTIFDKNGKVYTSNLLFKTNETQRNNIKIAYKSNPNNPILSFMNSQISTREQQDKDTEYLDIGDLL